MVALPGDRFILRGFRKLENYGTTVGGGVVVRVLSHKVRPRDRDAVALLDRMAGADDEARVALEVLAAGPPGITRDDLQRRLPMVPARVDRLLTALLGRREVVRFDKETGAVVHVEPLEALRQRLLGIVDAFHADNPLQAGISREELRSRLGMGIGPRLYHALLTDLGKRGDLVADRDICHRPDHRVQAAATAIRPLADQLLARIREAGLAPPLPAVLAETTGADPASVAAALKLLADEAHVTRVGGRLCFAAEHLDDLEQRLVAFLTEHGEITAPQFKELVGQTRKFTIPLAEHFDKRKVTLRVGEVRKLRG